MKSVFSPWRVLYWRNGKGEKYSFPRALSFPISVHVPYTWKMARKTKGVSVEERDKISRRSLEPNDVLTRCGERVTQSVVIDNATKHQCHWLKALLMEMGPQKVREKL